MNVSVRRRSPGEVDTEHILPAGQRRHPWHFRFQVWDRKRFSCKIVRANRPFAIGWQLPEKVNHFNKLKIYIPDVALCGWQEYKPNTTGCRMMRWTPAESVPLPKRWQSRERYAACLSGRPISQLRF